MTNDKLHFHLLQLCVGTLPRNLETRPGPDALLELGRNLVDSEKGDHALRARTPHWSLFARKLHECVLTDGGTRKIVGIRLHSTARKHSLRKLCVDRVCRTPRIRSGRKYITNDAQSAHWPDSFAEAHARRHMAAFARARPFPASNFT